MLDDATSVVQLSRTEVGCMLILVGAGEEDRPGLGNDVFRDARGNLVVGGVRRSRAGVPGLNCFRIPITSKRLGVGGNVLGMKMSVVPEASVIVEVVGL